MKTKLKLLLVAGARPNFMKIAPLIQAAASHNAAAGNGTPELECVLVHTGQHYDEKMSEVFFRELQIPAPDVNLEVGSGSHAMQTASVMLKFEPVCKAFNPDWVVVVGDVNSTVACALVAAKLGVKIVHVEAGLRSRDRSMPEEINRVVTDSIADLLLTPSPDADDNLKLEGIPPGRIRLVGNIMIDSLVSNLTRARQSQILERTGVAGKEFAFATLHRPSNVDSQESLAGIITALKKLSLRLPVVFPMHPRTQKMLGSFHLEAANSPAFHIIDPVGYHDSLCLAENARLVLTDSGGLQEETTYFRTPCLTLRPNTERPITVTCGSNRLTSMDTLSADLSDVLRNKERLGSIPSLWDGKTAQRCVQAVLDATTNNAPALR